MYVDDLLSTIFVRNTNFQFPVKSTWPPQSRIYCVASICCTDYNNIVTSLHSIQKCEKLCDYSAFNLT